jgi:hypothetical protein
VKDILAQSPGVPTLAGMAQDPQNTSIANAQAYATKLALNDPFYLLGRNWGLNEPFVCLDSREGYTKFKGAVFIISVNNSFFVAAFIYKVVMMSGE